MKIIPSRKGFDETTGGKASPIYDNRFISLPIPRVDSGVKYSDLIWDHQTHYLRVMKDLGIKLFTECHLDPDLSPAVLPNRHPLWRSAFGQSGADQSILANSGVDIGDLFLFFGWYQFVDRNPRTGCYRRRRGQGEGIHGIFGYMQIGEKYEVVNNRDLIPDWLQSHPHVFNYNDYTSPNYVYIASDSLSSDPTKPGAGTFMYSDELVLTRQGETRSKWRVPSFFQAIPRNDFKKIGVTFGENDGDYVNLTLRGQSQEVLISSDEHLVQWAMNLISNQQLWS